MRAAAFDPSSKIGWAVWDGESPRPTLGKKRVLGWDQPVEVMVEGLRLWLGKFVKEHRPEIVAIEAPAMGGHQDAPTIYRQAAVWTLIAWGCHVSGIPVTPYQNSTWRKTFIGFGTRGKRVDVDWKGLAKKRCRALDWPYPDHNAAEAGGILHHLLLDRGIAAPWRDDERAWLPLSELPDV